MALQARSENSEAQTGEWAKRQKVFEENTDGSRRELYNEMEKLKQSSHTGRKP